MIAFAYGCDKDDTLRNTETEVGHSRVTYFPSLELKGDRYVAIPVGGSFTDPGAEATAGGTAVTPVVGGAINYNTPGVYTLTYTATNSDGFSAVRNRTVVVYSTDASAAAHDLSGNYLRAATGETSTWTQIAPGVYTVLNPGGSPAGRSLMVIAVNPTGYTIKIPSQLGNDGNTSASSDEQYVAGPPATYQWKYLNPGANYGTGIRTFVKQ